MIKHFRKMKNYLFPDALPFPPTSGFPLPDLGMSSEDRAFCDLLHYHMNRGSVVPAEDVKHFLVQSDFGNLDALPPAKLFAMVIAHLALAYALGSATGRKDYVAQELFVADEAYRRYLKHTERAHMFFTEWPFFLLLLKVAEAFSAERRGEPSAQPNTILESSTSKVVPAFSPPIFVVYCGHLQFDLPSGLGLRKVLVEPEPSGGCRGALLEALRSPQIIRAAWVVVVSPFLQRWTSSHPHAFRSAAEFLHATGAQVAGFPVVDASGLWRWPVHRMRHEFWRLRYEPYPTGYSLVSGTCAGGDATSASRVYRGELLRELVGELQPDAEDATGANLFVELDLLALRRRLPAYTCMHPPLHEDVYLDRAVLTRHLGEMHSVEVADFGAPPPEPEPEPTHDAPAPAAAAAVAGGRQIRCGTTEFRDAYNNAQVGRATRYCYRRHLQRVVPSQEMSKMEPSEGERCSSLRFKS
mmetsp:Transcript_54808/g.177312  ORF Transcript_54808/g.177312 Transcript_54808/m.177312 type:complete len:469 (-) Transcript_54808:1067-2473(-)